MCRAYKPYVFKYWKYALCYVDSFLCVSHETDTVMIFAQSYTLKPGSVKEPGVYQGAKAHKFYIHIWDDPEKSRWSMSSDEYVKSAIANMEVELEL